MKCKVQLLHSVALATLRAPQGLDRSLSDRFDWGSPILQSSIVENQREPEADSNQHTQSILK